MKSDPRMWRVADWLSSQFGITLLGEEEREGEERETEEEISEEGWQPLSFFIDDDDRPRIHSPREQESDQEDDKRCDEEGLADHALMAHGTLLGKGQGKWSPFGIPPFLGFRRWQFIFATRHLEIQARARTTFGLGKESAPSSEGLRDPCTLQLFIDRDTSKGRQVRLRAWVKPVGIPEPPDGTPYYHRGKFFLSYQTRVGGIRTPVLIPTDERDQHFDNVQFPAEWKPIEWLGTIADDAENVNILVGIQENMGTLYVDDVLVESVER